MQNNPRHWYENILDLVDQLYQTNHADELGYTLFAGVKAFLPFDAAIFTPH